MLAIRAHSAAEFASARQSLPGVPCAQALDAGVARSGDDLLCGGRSRCRGGCVPRRGGARPALQPVAGGSRRRAAVGRPVRDRAGADRRGPRPRSPGTDAWCCNTSGRCWPLVTGPRRGGSCNRASTSPTCGRASRLKPYGDRPARGWPCHPAMTFACTRRTRIPSGSPPHQRKRSMRGWKKFRSPADGCGPASTGLAGPWTARRLA